ncbi:predicted protein [Botrytis cinerea T4]|uniref:Uncharacterized protein n=1 Tax=Botryotinia fuckeliana (strain T4) TaxID=999810 RepID=G2YD70_BOTF4|nr:predicted protein [Botrytis cinerea T4]
MSQDRSAIPPDTRIMTVRVVYHDELTGRVAIDLASSI